MRNFFEMTIHQPFTQLLSTCVISLSLALVGCGEKVETETPGDKSQPAETGGATAEVPTVTGVEADKIFTTVCAVCHGENGQGKLELHSPSIAGLPSWYVIEQIEKFRTGYRGTHPEDIPGMQMRAISLALNKEQLEAAAKLVEGLPSIPTSIIKEGDIERGRTIFAQTCMPCHRYNGRGERAFHSAPLVTLNPEYLRRSLENYAKGWRGAAELDFYGHKMVAEAQGMSDRDITDLVRFIGEMAHGDDPRKAMNW